MRPPPQPLRVGQEWAVQVSVRGARPSRFVVRLGARVARFGCCTPAVATVRGSRFRRPVAGVTASASAPVTGSSECARPSGGSPAAAAVRNRRAAGRSCSSPITGRTPSSDSIRRAAAPRSSLGSRALATYGRPRTERCSSPRAGTSTSSTRAQELFASACRRRAGSSRAGAQRRSLRRRGAVADRPHRGRRVASRPRRRPERRPRDPVDT